MFKRTCASILVSAILLVPSVAWSQGSALFGPHLGIQKSSGAENSNYLVGATLRIKLLPALAAEGDIGYRQEKYSSGAVTLKQWPITVTGLFYPLPFLYGGVGFGWYSTTADYSDFYNAAGYSDETTRKGGWHVGAGVEVPASPSVKLYGDVRYVFLDYKFKNLPGAVLDGAKSDFYSLNVGLLFRL